MSEDNNRVRLGRIRCLMSTAEAMKKGILLPQPLCFVAKELTFQYSKAKDPLKVYEERKLDSKVVDKIPEGKSTQFCCSGLVLFNQEGGWMKMESPIKGWVLLQPAKQNHKAELELVSVNKDPQTWLKVVEKMCSLQIVKAKQIANCDSDETSELQTPPPGWSLEADEELAQYLVKYLDTGISSGGGASGTSGEYYSSVEVSSNTNQVHDLLSSTSDEYWESNGSEGQHWIRLHMKPGVIVEQIIIVVDPDDSSYLPKRVVVKSGYGDTLSNVRVKSISMSEYQKREVPLLAVAMSEACSVIEIAIESCHRGGCDTRIHGIKLKANTSRQIFLDSECLSEEVFTTERIACFPKLQPFQPKQLFYRGLALKRAAYLLNLDLMYLLPRANEISTQLDSVIRMIRQLWPLCTKRSSVMTDLISATSSSKTPERPVLYINRISAKAHTDDPSKDPNGSKTVFNQVIRELKKHTKPSSYNFTWAGHWSQWWECKFIQEGIIDQGGGFRDSLSDIAEELCPSSPDAVVSLPLFIRSPNQSQDSSNVYRDAYIPNPSCTLYSQYNFIGQLMGGMVRSQESLVLSLPQFVWKQLVGDPVTWARDYISVDSAELKLIESITTMDRKTFESSFEGALKFTTVLSNGETVSLCSAGSDKLVTYDNRLEYCELVKVKRMEESKAQINAIKEGLVKVVPSDFLGLLTWQELEIKVCGNPEITVEGLKKAARYDSDLKAGSDRVKMMWDALEKFTNEERSRFLRFITGRRRLPCTIYINSGEGTGKLPTSATCSNTLYLPKYKNVEEAVEKLRYAAYNCIAIDTDMSPWEE